MSPSRESTEPRIAVVVMGVSASGKSTLGAALARALLLPFVEGDELHSRHNIEKMSRGEPLTDEDRAPWLAAIAALLGDETRYPRGVVVACSALKADHRNELRAASPAARFVFLDASPELIHSRMAARRHHFMPPKLQASQFAALQRPAPTEPNVISLDAALPVEALVDAARRALAR
ncbi:MAG: gluconokinase [Steroidobacteraceae bacterium]